MTAASISNQTKRSESGVRHRMALLRHPLYFVTTTVLIGAIIVLVIYLVLAINWFHQPFFGATVSRTLVVDAGKPAGTVPWPGLDAGLQHLDQIVALNGELLFDSPDDFAGARQKFKTILADLPVGETVTVEFDRLAVDGVVKDPQNICNPAVGGVSRCTVTYALGSVSDADFLIFFVVPYVSGLIVLLIGVAVFWLRPNQPVPSLVSIICAAQAVFMAGVFDYGVTQALAPLWLVATTFLGGALVTLGMTFPDPLRLLYARPYLRYAPFLVSAALAALAVFRWFNPGQPRDYQSSIQVAIVAAITGLVLLFLMVFQQRRNATSTTVRDQSSTIVIGILVVLIPAAGWTISLLIRFLSNSRAGIPFNTEVVMPFAIPPAASIAYAVLQYRQLNTDKIISHSIAYFLMLGALITGYFLLVLGVALFANEIAPDDPLLVAFVVFFIALLFLPIRTRLQWRIDAIYFRTRRSYQEKTEQFVQKLTTLDTLDEIVQEFRGLLEDTIAPLSMFVFLPNRNSDDYIAYGIPRPETDVRFARTSGVVTLLKKGDHAVYLEPGRPWPPELPVDRTRLTLLRALFIAGLSGGESLTGFVIISPPRSGAGRYAFEELRFLMNAIRQFGLAVERAQVIDSLQGRVQELDVLSQVGQAVNFTIEFDDLLELINAQTNKLIDASYFYIALRDTTIDQLYFAFFLEDDERYREKEDERWPIGRDLLSEVVRTAQPIRVEDFAKAMAVRDVKILHENPNLKAWMGVPLSAGTRVLGVLAVAKTVPGETYTDDQLKIFIDIGALAALSLDKARLFAETNMRARQLTVLNEISRQLVATESDVEKLLEIIMSSAVDILNAEAGSLLLTVDDGTNDLEFRVAVGGSGQSLVGSRLPAGHGLVGQVAKSGEPVIVNDVAHDPRHGGEVANGKFKTNSILAVPLTTKEKVIGVLEVLNKKDGTIYVDQDVELLTTFAGQAAIAIENARLFEMTDLQLTKRVEELEVLEQIDVELNRTLDLHKVAEITVRWAIANSGATAGLLGIIPDEDSDYMEIVASYGYEDEDFPEGAEDGHWPLNRGIVRRLMRTHQADLAPDVAIDPDYEPGLRDSLSQITIPMYTGEDINAILILETNREPRLTLSDWGFAQRLAEHASIAISNAQLYEELTLAIESKSEFMGFAAHELKTPLSSVKGYADVLLNGMTGPLDDQQKNFLTIIRSNADRLQTIIDDLRDAARAEANKLSIDLAPISFWNVVIETLRPFQKQLDDKKQEIVNNVPEDLPQIMGDQTRLIQVMTNLVSNAHKYSPPEGTITIGAEVIEGYVNDKGRKFGNVLQISVADNGIGMSEEDLSKLFRELYFRSENPLTREQPGTGLGMMITRSIIERHNGEIRVESELNVGTTFFIVIPLITESTKVRHPEAAPASD